MDNRSCPTPMRYDANNNLTSKTDRNGNTINYSYDQANRLVEKLYPDSTGVNYTFDSFGKQVGSSGSLTNPFQYTAREFDAETGLYYYRARYYDPSTARFLSEDPTNFDADENFYRYVHNNSVNSADPFGLDVGEGGPQPDPHCYGPTCGPATYVVKPGVPVPSPDLDRFLKCLSSCIGQAVLVTSTTEGKHQDPGHARGTSVDIRPPNESKHTVFCCAGMCGAKWGLDEGPGGQKFKYTSGFNYHFQLIPPRRPNPKAPNSIPLYCAGCPNRIL